jgi:ATP-dependent Lhr-like helicase
MHRRGDGSPSSTLTVPTIPVVLHERVEAWLTSRGFRPFDFQRRTWDAFARGESGLVHAPTGMGKTLSVWLGPVSEYLEEHPDAGKLGVTSSGAAKRHAAAPLTVLWITPLRALATDTAGSLRAPIDEIGLPWNVETRTGDTPQSLRTKQRDRLPTALVTTPESLSLLLTRSDARERLASVRCVVVDEWHELLSSKRGVQVELALARLRRFARDAGRPLPSVWGLSATIANIDEAARVLVGPSSPEPVRITAKLHKPLSIETVVPEDISRFPWSGHLGLNMLPEVIDLVDASKSSLIFCNTRSQVELWFKAIMDARPDWLGRVSLHHGSIDREIRDKVEQALREGRAKCVVCTSSLDLGVDFSPVELVFQVGSPKGVARLLQRAGRSGHQPGSTSRIVGVPAHAFELVEFVAAREAALAGQIESRTPHQKPLDVLVQHVVTIATGEGFDRGALLDEIRDSYAFRNLTDTEFGWALDFVTRGGPALDAYPEFARVLSPEEQRRQRREQRERERQRRLDRQHAHHSDESSSDAATAASNEQQSGDDDLADDDGDAYDSYYRVASKRIATQHRLNVGTITADQAVQVRFINGRSLGAIEESFIGKLTPGQRFVFAGRVLELVQLRDMTASVRTAKSPRGVVPRWGGGRSPLSTKLAAAVRLVLDRVIDGVYDAPELDAVRPVLELQRAVSALPRDGQLLIEHTATRDGHHAFVYPFEGRQVHEGLGAVLAHRLANLSPRTVTTTPNDYGLELLSTEHITLNEHDYRRLLSTDDLLDDLIACLNAGQLARRRFRDIARIAGLIHPGYPGQRNKASRHLQASSEMFFDVLNDFDPANLLLDQAKREVLEAQLEVARLRRCLQRCAQAELVVVHTERLTPLGFPLFAERLRTQMVSSEKFRERIQRMALHLEDAAPSEAETG